MKENKKGTALFPLSLLYDFLRGIGIGVAFIIPGFSGGSVAAILGIYERLIGAIAGIFGDFRNSVTTLLPVGLGMGIGAAALLFPIKWALGTIPLPTVTLFVGLTLGCLPVLFKEVRGKFKLANLLALLIPMILVAATCALPIGQDVNLYSLTILGHVLLILIGILGSSALVIPGISGSMLLLMLGYYNPIVDMATSFLKTTYAILIGSSFTASDVYKPILVLSLLALGIGVGFIGISLLMKRLFKNYRRGTYFAIIGFILGSVPSVYVSTVKEAGYTASNIPTSPIHWIGCAMALILGVAISLFLVLYSRKKANA